ncbi:YDG/SRA domain-containing protein [Blastococcus sp. SYSU DS0619]
MVWEQGNLLDQLLNEDAALLLARLEPHSFDVEVREHRGNGLELSSQVVPLRNLGLSSTSLSRASATAWLSHRKHLENRDDLAASQVHRPNQGGICGTKATGAESIVVNGAYADEDYGSELIYTGAGGRDANTSRQVADQTLDQPGNAAL